MNSETMDGRKFEDRNRKWKWWLRADFAIQKVFVLKC
jgi:hypothetical protein